MIAAALAVSVVWSLDDRLWVAGHSTIWLPWALFEKLPLLDEVIPSRVALYTALGSAVVLAMWLARGSRHHVWRWAAALLAAALLFPATGFQGHAVAWSWDDPPFFTTGAYKRYLRPDEVVLPIPWGRAGLSLLWQAQTQMYFRLASGSFNTEPNTIYGEPIVPQLWWNSVGSDAGPQLHDLLVARRVDDVVVDDVQLALWRPVLSDAGLRRRASIGGVTIYRLSEARSGT
ncbi:MAG: hypothetical protein ACLP8S_29545 [Solirubrobacteraceae bacterium]